MPFNDIDTPAQQFSNPLIAPIAYQGAGQSSFDPSMLSARSPLDRPMYDSNMQAVLPPSLNSMSAPTVTDEQWKAWGDPKNSVWAEMTKNKGYEVKRPGFSELWPFMFFGPNAVNEAKTRIMNERARPVVGRLTQDINEAMRNEDWDKANNLAGEMYNLSGQFPQLGPLAQQLGDQIAKKQNTVATNEAQLNIAKEQYKGDKRATELINAMAPYKSRMEPKMLQDNLTALLPELKVNDNFTMVLDKFTGQERQPKQFMPATTDVKDLGPHVTAGYATHVAPAMPDFPIAEYAKVKSRLSANDPKLTLGEIQKMQQADKLLYQGVNGQLGGVQQDVLNQRVPASLQAEMGIPPQLAQGLAGIPGAGQPQQGMPSQAPQMPQGAMQPQGNVQTRPQAPMAPQGRIQPQQGIPQGRPVPKGNVDQAVQQYSPQGQYQPQSPYSTYTPPRVSSGLSPAEQIKANKMQQDIQLTYGKEAATEQAKRYNKGSEESYDYIDFNNGNLQFAPKQGKSLAELDSGKYLKTSLPEPQRKWVMDYTRNKEVLLDAFNAVRDSGTDALPKGGWDLVASAIDKFASKGLTVPVSLNGNTLTLGGSSTIALSTAQSRLWTKLIGAMDAVEGIMNPGNHPKEEMAYLRNGMLGALTTKGTALEAIQGALRKGELDVLGMMKTVPYSGADKYISQVPEIPKELQRKSLTENISQGMSQAVPGAQKLLQGAQQQTNEITPQRVESIILNKVKDAVTNDTDFQKLYGLAKNYIQQYFTAPRESQPAKGATPGEVLSNFNQWLKSLGIEISLPKDEGKKDLSRPNWAPKRSTGPVNDKALKAINE